MADPMKIRAQMAGDKVDVRILMSHEMETGQRKDSKGALIPAWFIQNVTATWNGKTVLSAEWGPAVAKNPYLSFKFAGEIITNNNFSDQDTASQAFTSFTNSPHHREILLDPRYNLVGVGEDTNSSGFHYFTVVFVQN